MNSGYTNAATIKTGIRIRLITGMKERIPVAMLYARPNASAITAALKPVTM